MTRLLLAAVVVAASVAQTIGQSAGATAGISGHVVRSHDGGPLRFATVTVESFDGKVRRTTTTDAGGLFAFGDLTPGQYAVQARAAAYAASWWRTDTATGGASYAVLAAGEQRRVRIALPRGGVITGRIVDAEGTPVEGVPVHALVSEYRAGRELLRETTARPRVSDDRGEFRIFGLEPGKYFVAAVPGAHGGPPGHTLTYYPGVAAIAEATSTSVAADRESAIGDLALWPSATAAIRGTVFDRRGMPRADTELVLLPASGPLTSLLPRATSDSAGRFAFDAIPPGQYLLQNLPPPATPSEFGVLALAVTSGTTTATLRLQPATPGRGRVVFEAGDAPDFAPRQLIVALQAAESTASPLARGARVKVLEDWSLEMTNIWGPQSMRLLDPPDGWMIRHIYAGSADFVDRPIDFSRHDMPPIQVVLTRRGAVITGTVRNEDRALAAGGRVVIFAADADRWIRDDRAIQSTKVDAGGRYRSRPMPAGDYLVAAVDDLPVHDWPPRPALLEALRAVASAVTASEGRTNTRDLVLSSAPQ